MEGSREDRAERYQRRKSKRPHSINLHGHSFFLEDAYYSRNEPREIHNQEQNPADVSALTEELQELIMCPVRILPVVPVITEDREAVTLCLDVVPLVLPDTDSFGMFQQHRQ